MILIISKEMILFRHLNIDAVKYSIPILAVVRSGQMFNSPVMSMMWRMG